MKKWREFHLRVDKEVFAEFEKIAKEEGLTITALIRHLIHKKVNEKRRKRGKKIKSKKI